MKLSCYNNTVKLGEKYIIFNALHYKFICLDSPLYKLFSETSVNELRDIHLEFYESLLENGVIVNENHDEFSILTNLIEKIDNDNKNYRLIINPTLNCNFNCWYCYEERSISTKMDVDMINRVLLLINNILVEKNPKHFQLSFFGGEPMLYFTDIILPIAKHAYSQTKRFGKKFFFDITTNGYLLNRIKLEELIRLGLNSCQITLDGNKDEHDKVRYNSKLSGSYSSIINNIKTAVQLGVNIVLRINYTQLNLKNISEIFSDFQSLTLAERKRIFLSMNKVWQETNEDLDTLVDDFQQEAKNFGFNIPEALLSDRVRNSCYADKTNEAVINYNGNVYKCNARNFTEDSKDGVLNDTGHIIWNNQISMRKRSELINDVCRKCSILPICGGGCSQIAYENRGKEFCVNKDKSKVEKMIISLFLSESNETIM